MPRPKATPVPEHVRDRLMNLKVWQRHNKNVGDFVAYTQNTYEADPLKIRIEATKIAKSLTAREAYVKKKLEKIDRELAGLAPERKRIASMKMSYGKKRMPKMEAKLWRRVKSLEDKRKKYGEEAGAYGPKRSPTYWNTRIRQMGIKKEDIEGPLVPGKQERLGAFGGAA